MASGSELIRDERQGVSNHLQHAGSEAEQGSRERPAMQFLFWSHQQDQQHRLGRALGVYSLSLMSLCRATCMKQSTGEPSRASRQFGCSVNGFFSRFSPPSSGLVSSFSMHSSVPPIKE